MSNPYRGEVRVVVDGTARQARLSLGALVTLEETLGEQSLLDLVKRFEDGQCRARDILVLLAAGLGMTPADLAEAEIEGGPVAAAKAAAELLRRCFEMPGSSA